MKKNILLNILYQIVVVALPLISTPYISRVLGAEGVGQYSYALSFSTYFVIFATLGSSLYGQRQVAFYMNNRVSYSEVFWNVVCFRLISSAIAGIVYWIWLSCASNFDRLSLIMGANIVNVAIDITWFWQGREEFKRPVTASTLIKILCFVLTFVLINDTGDIWLYALLSCVGPILANMLMWIGISRIINLPKNLAPLKDIQQMISIFLPTIATQVYTVLDKSMINWITGSFYSNGCYEMSEKIVRTAICLTTAISATMMPRVASLFHNNEIDEARDYVYKVARLTLLLVYPMMAGLFAVAPSFIPLFLGNGYDMSVPLLQIFVLLLFFVSVASIVGVSYLIPTKQQTIYTLSVVAGASVNLVLNLFLIRWLDALGAAIASVVAEGIGVGIQLLYCSKTNQLSLKRLFLPTSKYFVASILMMGVVMLIVRSLPITIGNLVIEIMIGIALYAIALFILRDELFREVIWRMMNRIAKGKTE